MIMSTIINKLHGAALPTALLIFITVVFVMAVMLFLVRYIRNKRLLYNHSIDHIFDSPKTLLECEDYFEQFAQHHKQTKLKSSRRFMKVLTQKTYRDLIKLRRQLSAVSADIISLVPSARWLFGNYYALYIGITKVQCANPSKTPIPVLTSGKNKGSPRICVIAREIIKQISTNLTEENVAAILLAYQKTTPLTSAELWMLHQVLNLTLLESIAYVAGDILKTIATKQAADDFISAKLSSLSNTCDLLQILNIKEHAEFADNVTFCSHVIYCLKNISLDESQINKWAASVCTNLFDTPTPAGIISVESRNEAFLESTTRLLFTSLRGIGSFDFTALFETVSPIEQILRHDPSGIYPQMDFETRDYYRHALERIALRFGLTQWVLAEKILRLAASPSKYAHSDHVGTYLIGKARPMLYAVLKDAKRIPDKEKPECKIKGKAYFLTIMMFFTCIEILLLFILNESAYSFIGWGAVLFICISIPLAIGIANELTNFIFTNLVMTKHLPSLDFKEGLPDDCRTFVVLPVLLGNPEHVAAYVSRLEKHYLANNQNNLHFAILGDFTDAPQCVMPQDEAILQTAVEAIQKLNDKYPAQTPRFSVLMRSRCWNDCEGHWMGWERKRGKLEELNALLCGDADTTYVMITGNTNLVHQYKYIITLDADTDLVRDSAAKLAGTAAHPLNRPVMDKNNQRITDGYAIIQPEVRNHLFSKENSRFSHTFASNNGMDTYSNMTSDIYQDTFNEGTFVGKGIYDIEFLHCALRNKFPVNRVLSHDLLESCYVRCAFQSEAVLLDSYPSNIESYTRREHRWIRGDWQLIPWLFKRAPINTVSRWKIADNMRRSLIPICELALILICVFLLPQLFFFWVPLVLFHTIFSLIVPLVKTIVQKALNPQSKVLLLSLGAMLLSSIQQSLYTFILIPYRAWVAADAIVRTLFRLLISHKKLMQWHSTEFVEKSLTSTVSGYFLRMIPAMILACALIAGIILSDVTWVYKTMMTVAGILWLLSPVIAYGLSKPYQTQRERAQLQAEDISALRLYARRIWQYTLDFSTPDNHWLCPDNYQLFPVTKVTDKTSPTNIGLQFLSILTARDLGFIGLSDLVASSENLLRTVQALPKWNGHLYNWYNIKTLEVLNPVYVSTVDSGNFVSYLVTLKNGLLEALNQPIYCQTAVQGIRDTLMLSGCDGDFPETFSSIQDFLYAVGRLKSGISAQKGGASEDSLQREALTATCESFLRDAAALGFTQNSFSSQRTLSALAEAGEAAAAQLMARIDRLNLIIDELVGSTDYKLLFNKKRQLLHIGYRVHAQMPDDSYYDLAASEAIQTSFIAIAKGDLPLKHWSFLGRPLTLVRGLPAYVSWSGTMFEYLLPCLIMKDYRGSAFTQSHRAAILHQMIYASKNKIPWGISESQYFCFDTDSNYQYRAFGITKLRLEPGTYAGKIVSPYSTFLAISYVFRKAMKNIKAMEALGSLGKYGLYEAIDFDSPDPDAFRNYSIVKSFMAHHLGMSLTAINNLLNNNIMQERFHNEPMIRAAESLLEETRQSFVVTLARRGYSVDAKQTLHMEDSIESRYIHQTSPLYPRVNWLSNGHYSLLVNSDGDGFSSCHGMMLYRWRADRFSSYGNYIYIRDTKTSKYWSAAYKPTCTVPDEYQAIFQMHQAEFIRRDGDITTHTSVTISASKNVEIRKVNFNNHSKHEKELETTSYFEIVMAIQTADMAHPAFNKMFVESEYIPEKSLLIYKHRTASSTAPRYLMHTVKLKGHASRPTEFETDRLRFLGRNRTPQSPAALDDHTPLGSKAGFSLDPIMSIRSSIILPPESTASISYITAACFSREEAIALCDELQRPLQIDDVFEQFRINSMLELKYLKITSAQCNQYLDMIGPLFYPLREMRGPQESMERNWKDQSGMWRFGISGDYPIMLLRTTSVDDVPFIKDILNAYAFLRINSIPVDLVILNEQPDGYKQDLNNLLFELTSTLKIYDISVSKPSLFILQAWQMAQPEIDLFLTTARIVYTNQTGVFFRTVREQLEDTQRSRLALPRRAVSYALSPVQPSSHISPTPSDRMEFFNGCGGFVRDGKEYEIILTPAVKPPAPWINVIANETFGFLVSETGAGYTWSLNSRENKITSWSNDPVVDPPSEAVYIRDDDTGDIFLPCSLGAVHEGRYVVRHGFGYTQFVNDTDSLGQEMTMFVPLDDPVRIWQLTLTNKLSNDRHLTVTLYVELTLNVSHEIGSSYVFSAFDETHNCMTAKSIYNFYFRKQTAFLFSSEDIVSYTGDRLEFLGINGTVQNPNGIHSQLQNRTGTGLDPCAAIQISVVLLPGETKTINFGLGQSEQSSVITALCKKYRNPENAADALTQVTERWLTLVSRTRISTNDRALDILANGWLQYQTLACRVLARTAFYQCGGAYGFRDQLQDVLALLDDEPAIVKKQILLVAAHQYQEGDVQHWWHPYTGQGVRTRMTDDLLWLAYAVSKYVSVTDDVAILDETVPFMIGPPLEPNEGERMHQAKLTEERYSIYEHCLRALHRVRLGAHGLPLMGGGDWNDGMNKVGKDGKGESVWLAWFYDTVCKDFARICKRSGIVFNEIALLHIAENLETSIENHGWDGEWYLRAYYDDGEKLGSADNSECRIDSISQSWSVISGAGNPERVQTAVGSANALLIKPEAGVSLLLDPPFNSPDKDPGYIRNYYPGMRENGGQYTHAAVWLVMANAMLKNRDAAYQQLTMLNPINTAATPAGTAKYMREPYVMPADISTAPPYVGQGGWSWYTGSAGWMYQAIINWFLGIRREGSCLVLDPAVPAQFGSYTVDYNYGHTLYSIHVKPGETPPPVLVLDGKVLEGRSIQLVDDGQAHTVELSYMS